MTTHLHTETGNTSKSCDYIPYRNYKIQRFTDNMAEQKCTRDEKKSKTFVKVLLYTRLIDSLTEDGIKLAKKNIIS